MIELQLLNYILNTSDYSIVTSNAITTEMFTKYAPVFDFVKEHYAQYGTVPDKLTVVDKFTDFDFTEVNESKDYLVSRFFEEFQFRQGAPKLQAAFEAYKEDSNKGIEELKKILPSLSIQPNTSTVSLMKDYNKRLTKYRERAMNPLRNHITTGFIELDKALGGWDREEDLIIIFARPGKGKSWVAVKSAAEAARAGFKVLYYSGEISDDMLGYRVDTTLFNISNYKLTRSDVSIMNEYETAVKQLESFRGDIQVVTPKELGGLLSPSKLRAIIEKSKPDIVFLDQISLMEDDRKGKSEPERVTNIIKDLTTLRAELRLPLVVVSQQNRSENENSAGTENISNSDRIGQDATLVLNIERKNPDLLILKLIKSRFSSSGEKFTYRWRIDKGEYEYVPTEGSESSSESTTSYEPKTQAQVEYDNSRRAVRQEETQNLRSQFRDRRRDVF